MDLYAIWSERNNAVRECNMAVAEKRQAMMDRDIAIFQRDAAFVERDNARMQRDDAFARLELKTNLMNASSVMMHNPSESGPIHNLAESGVMHDLAESGVIHDPSEDVMHNPAESGVSVSQGVMEMQVVQKPQQQQQRRHPVVNYSEIAFKPVEVPFSDVFAQPTTTASKSAKSKKVKQETLTKAVTSRKALKPTRETKTVLSNKASRFVRETKTVLLSNKASRPVRETKTVSVTKVLKPTRKISKRTTRVSNNKQVTVANHPSSNNGTNGRNGISEKQHASKGGFSLNDLGLDYANLPVPFCSCTGNHQSCYKWGKGGWQSACCTTTLSTYPLPQMPNKRNSRMGGRKMSGGAFTKLITRLASEGHDITSPIDLKNHWARHGTNRYIIIR